MNFKIFQYKQLISTVLFLLTCLMAVFLHQLFDAQNNLPVDKIREHNPFRELKFNSVSSVEITNKQGHFVVKNLDHNLGITGPWKLVEPRIAAVGSNTIIKIAKMIENFSVTKYLSKDQISEINYQLNTPILTIAWIDNDGKHEIKVGSTNDADNSSYLTLDSSSNIFAVQGLNPALANIQLSELAQAEVFNINFEKISGLLITNFQTKKEIVKINNLQLAEIKWKKLLEKLFEVKSFLFLDQIQTIETGTMDSIFQQCSFDLTFNYENVNETYHICEIPQNLKAFPVTPEKGILVFPENSHYPFVVPLSTLQLLKEIN